MKELYLTLIKLKISVPPQTNLDDEIKISKTIQHFIKKGLITACHDISDGGLLVSILEMCLSKEIGFNFYNLPKSHKILFGEDQSRYLIAVNKSKKANVEKLLSNRDICYKYFGSFTCKNQILNFPDKSSIKLETIKTMRKFWESKV